MGKAEELLKAMGGTIAESAAHRGTPAAMPTAPAPAAPDRLAGLTRSKSAFEIPVDRIEADPDQPRETFDEDALARLAASIGSKGVLQPIRVRWDQGRGVHMIVAGERRWRATRLAGLATIPAVVDDRPSSPAEILAMQVVENALREDLMPVEQARAYKALMDLNGWSGNQLSKELGIAQSGVVQALSLLSLPAEVQAAVDSGKVAASAAAQLSRLDDRADQVELAGRIEAEGLSRAEVVEAVKARTPRPKGRGGKARPTEKVMRLAGGVRVTVESRRGLDDAGVHAALLEALARIAPAEGKADAA